MTSLRARILCVEFGIGQTIKSHGGRPGKHHAKDNKQEDLPIYNTYLLNSKEEPEQGEWHGKNGV